MNKVIPPKTVFDAAKLATALKIIEVGKARTGRECGDCSLCCRLLPIDNVPGLNKPAGTWCRHCRPGKGGCGIYDERPAICRGFACLYLVDCGFSEAWKPTKSKIVVRQVPEIETNAINIHFTVDSSVPNRWREEPFYSDIKHVATTGLNASNGTAFRTYVEVGDRLILILPKKEVDVADQPHVIGNSGGPDDWTVATFTSTEQARNFIAGMEGARKYLMSLPVAEREPALKVLIARLGKGRRP